MSSSLPTTLAIAGTAFFLLTQRAKNTPQSKSSPQSAPLSLSITSDASSYQTTLTRVMLPDDANPAGNVHGGTILKMMEMSAFVLATRHANANVVVDGVPMTAVLASIQQASFLKPMHVGDVSHVRVKILATYSSSIEIHVRVYREDLRNRSSTPLRQLTNEAHLWYVRVAQSSDENKTSSSSSSFRQHRKFQVCPGVAHIVLSPSDASASQARKLLASLERTKRQVSSNVFDPKRDPTNIVIARLSLPSDATSSGLVFGGVLAKEMDSAAGVTAWYLARTNCVTVSMDNFVLLTPCMVGDYLRVRTRIVFVSNKTAELEAVVTRPDSSSSSSCSSSSSNGVEVKEPVCARASFTFVSLGSDGRVKKMPKWSPSTEIERELFDEAEARYEMKKKERLAVGENVQIKNVNIFNCITKVCVVFFILIKSSACSHNNLLFFFFLILLLFIYIYLYLF